MKEVIVISGSKKGFTASYADNHSRLEYTGWMSRKAEIYIGDELYTVAPTSFFSSSADVLKNGRPVLQLRMNWKGDTKISESKESGHFYTFRHQGFFTSGYMITDEKGTELFWLESKFKWSKFNADYTISAAESFHYEGNELLVMVAVYCANYYASMQMAVM